MFLVMFFSLFNKYGMLVWVKIIVGSEDNRAQEKGLLPWFSHASGRRIRIRALD